MIFPSCYFYKEILFNKCYHIFSLHPEDFSIYFYNKNSYLMAVSILTSHQSKVYNFLVSYFMDKLNREWISFPTNTLFS